MTRIAVIGAGIVGAAIAHYAHRRGADVTLIDPAPPAAGATGASFGWIGESVLPGGGVLPAWRHLEETVPGIHVSWTGSLTWPGTPDDHGDHGEHIDTAAITALEPRLRNPPPSGVYRASDGAVDPNAATTALTAAVTKLTAAVTAVHHHSVETTAGPIPADTTVIAAGTATPGLSGTTLPIDASPAALVRYDAPPGLINTVISGPVLEIRQTSDGRLLAPAACSPHPTQAELNDIARRTTHAINETFDGADTIHLRGVEVGNRPMPTDGKPVIGPLATGLYVAVMHSGVTLAPLVARLVTQEILDQREAPELAGCRPARFPA